MAASKNIQFDSQDLMICAVLPQRARLSASARLSLVVAVVVGALASLLILVPQAEAATINVTPGAVDAVANGNCSIREAIRAANTDVAVDACPAGSGADTINAFGSYVLTTADNDANGLPVIESAITINYANISRPQVLEAFRIFEVADTGHLTLNAVTVSGGLATDCPYQKPAITFPAEACGGGIANNGTLTVSYSKIIDNEVTATTSFAWGGGIDNNNVAAVTGTVVSGNSATNTAPDFSGSLGGGVASSGTSLNVRSSRIESNTSSCSGGGPGPFGGCFALSGGTHNAVGTLDVRGSEIKNNTSSCSGDNCSAVGAGITQEGITNITSSKVSGNTSSCSASGCISFSGGIASLGTVNLTSSQVVGNTASCSTSDCLARGGGLDNDFGGTLNVTSSQVVGNTVSAPQGTARGGGLFNGASTSTLTNSSVTSNTASGAIAAGGGIFNDGGTVILNTTFVSGNTPDNCEPAIGACT